LTKSKKSCKLLGQLKFFILVNIKLKTGGLEMDRKTLDELKKYSGVVILGLIAIELIILLSFTGASCNDSYTVFLDANGTEVDRAAGTLGIEEIKSFKKERGIPKEDKIDDYDYTTEFIEVPDEFNTRGWIVASVAIPVFLLLLAAAAVAVVKSSLFSKEDEDEKQAENEPFGKTTLEQSIRKQLGSNIFFILAVVLVGVVGILYILPNTAIFLGQTGANIFAENKALILTVAGLAVGYIIFSTFLRHRRNMRVIMEQADIQKHRDTLHVQLQLGTGEGGARQITTGDEEVVDADYEKMPK